MINKTALILAALGTSASNANAGFHSEFSTFETEAHAIWTNTFDDAPLGASQALSYTLGDYSYTLEATGPGNGRLFNHDGVLSTESGLDSIRITLSGDPVYAVGAHAWCVDAQGNTIGGYLSIILEDGTSEIWSSTGPDNFRGFNSEVPIQSMVFEMPGPELWVALDNLAIGVVPAPSSSIGLALAGLAVSRRRRTQR